MAEPKPDWLLRVLGIAVGASPATPLLPLWRDARAALDAQVATVQGVLRAVGNPMLDDIAEFGFNGLTGRSSTALMAALFEHDAQPGPRSAAGVRAAIAGFDALLGPGSLLDDYDANPFGAAVSFRTTLTSGLQRLRDALPADGASA